MSRGEAGIYRDCRNILADRSVKGKLNQEQCAAQGGQFTKESQWMVHAWIWKDSPTGVFSPTNPMVQ